MNLSVLVEYKYIDEWEKGFQSFKELHISDTMKTITHWDIEQYPKKPC